MIFKIYGKLKQNMFLIIFFFVRVWVKLKHYKGLKLPWSII